MYLKWEHALPHKLVGFAHPLLSWVKYALLLKAECGNLQPAGQVLEITSSQDLCSAAF